MPSRLGFVADPQQWRTRAEQTRLMADLTDAPEAKQRLLGIADGYARFAAYAEERLAAVQRET